MDALYCSCAFAVSSRRRSARPISDSSAWFCRRRSNEASIRRFDCSTSRREEMSESAIEGGLGVSSLIALLHRHQWRYQWRSHAVAAVPHHRDRLLQADLSQPAPQPHDVRPDLGIGKPRVLPGERGELFARERPPRMAEEEV